MKLEGRGPGLFNVGGGTIELTDDGVVIQKKNADLSGTGGLLDVAIGVASASKGGMLLPYASIHTVNISEGGWSAPPFIQVMTPGEAPVSNSEIAMKTPSCLLFKKAALPEFQRLRAEIERRAVAARKSLSVPAAPAPSAADEIAKLGRLLADGLITQAEFDGKKKQILGL